MRWFARTSRRAQGHTSTMLAQQRSALLGPASRRQAAFRNRAARVQTTCAMKVAVTGASGRTGALVVKKLLQRPGDFSVVALVRSSKSADKLKQLGCSDDSIIEADVGKASAQQLQQSLAGCDALVIATSAVPQLKPLSLVKVFWAKITGQEGVRPDFGWKGDQLPEQVDWLGQKVQIDAAKAAGIKKVVLVSSMGGTDPENMLNKLGDGNILQWKRKAEQYLMASGITYTIIHPGGLIDEKGGQRELVVGIDDTLLKRKVRSIPREDVAELCIQGLELPEAENRSFDAISLPVGEGSITTDFAKLLAVLKGNCDYSINSQMAGSETTASATA